MSDVSAASCWDGMPVIIDMNFQAGKWYVEEHGTVDFYRVKMTTQLVVFILFTLAALSSVFAFNRLFDLNNSFFSQMGGIGCGATLPFLGLAAYYSYKIQTIDGNEEKTKHKIITALITIAALAVIIGGSVSGTFSSEWKGLIFGGAIGTVSVKLAHERGQKILDGRAIRLPTVETRTGFLIETAKKTALFVFIVGLMIAALWANAKMFGSNPDFAGQWKGMIAGGTVALLGAGLYHLAKRYYKGDTVSNLTENPRHRLMFAISTIALVCFIILHGTGAFDLHQAFHQWQGMVTAGLLTLAALKLTHFMRDLTQLMGARKILEAGMAAAPPPEPPPSSLGHSGAGAGAGDPPGLPPPSGTLSDEEEEAAFAAAAQANRASAGGASPELPVPPQSPPSVHRAGAITPPSRSPVSQQSPATVYRPGAITPPSQSSALIPPAQQSVANPPPEHDAAEIVNPTYPYPPDWSDPD